MPKDFAEFFAGIGLVREGLRAGGWRCIFANDNEPKKREMYEGHFGRASYFILDDIRWTGGILRHLTRAPFLATASFPCTDLSLAGHWKGLRGRHSSTFFAFTEVIRQMPQRPRVLMIENVVGFLTSDLGRDVRRAISELADLGYWIDAIVLDAKHFVPQSRPRLFLLGFADGVGSGVLVRQQPAGGMNDPWRTCIRNSATLRPRQLVDVLESLTLPTGMATLPLQGCLPRTLRLKDLIDVDDRQQWWDERETTRHYQLMEPLHRARVDALRCNRGLAIGTGFRRTRRGSMRLEVRFDIAGCLRTPRGGSAKQIVLAIQNGNIRMRWMSAREYARLQGVPDYVIKVGEIQAMYGFGDAVCVPAIEWIDQHILTPVFESEAAGGRKSHGRPVLRSQAV